MEILAIIMFVISLLGFVMIIFPQTFIREQRVVFLNPLLLLIFLLRGFIHLFPDNYARFMYRVVGLVIVGVCWFFGISFLNSPLRGKVSFYDSQSVEVASVPEEISDEEYEVIVENEGPAYTNAVIKKVREKRPEWVLYSPQPMILHVVDPKTWMIAPFEFKWALYNGTPMSVRAETILENAGSLHRSNMRKMQKNGNLAEEVAANQRKFGHLSGGGVFVENLEGQELMPPLEEADDFIQMARDAWTSGDTATAVEKAQSAWRIRAYHLSADHPETKEVEEMLRAAQQALSQVTQ